MGVSTNIYGVWGIRMEYDHDFSAAYDEVYDDARTPNVILDGMMGEYIVLGHQFYDSGDMRYGMEGGDQLATLSAQDMTKLEAEYKQRFVTVFPEFAHLVEPAFEVVVFTHWS